MKRLQIRLLFATIFTFAALVSLGYSQDFLETESSTQPFSIDSLGLSIGLPRGESKKLTVDAQITEAPNEGTDFFVKDGAAPIGFLAIQTTVADGWHIYSPTQGEGGMPTKFTELQITGENSELVALGDVALATRWTNAQDVNGAQLEELFGAVDWLAPLYAIQNAQPDLSKLKIVGVVKVLACSEGDGGTCEPQTEEFSANYSPNLNLTKALQVADEIAKESTKGAATETTETTGTTETTETGNTNSLEFASYRIFTILLTAFLGGLILNVTPCVLPVVGLKILSFFEQAGKSRARAFVLNLWYALGVLLVFGTLAIASVGLSFLFTRAIFQILMSAIVFVMALSLVGVWELQTPSFLGGEKSNKLASQEGGFGAVCKGIITTLLAIPCGAPLLSPALDWAAETSRQGHVALVFIVYLVIGFGMTFPFLVAGAFPELLKFFPKPGEWMETFRKTMGYFLLIAVVWILYSAPLEYLLPTVTFLFALWFACWNIGRNQWEVENPKKKLVGWVVSLVVLVVVGMFSFDFPANPIHTTLQSASEEKLTRWAERAQRDGSLTRERWALFDRETLERELAQGRIVVVDFTADWCMNCKFLEKTILKTPEVEAKFDEKNALTLTADWTNQDAQTPDVVAINELFDKNGARQVPTLMIFTPEQPERPIVLRGLYSKRALLEALESL